MQNTTKRPKAERRGAAAVVRYCERKQSGGPFLLRDGEAEAFGGAAALQVADDAGA